MKMPVSWYEQNLSAMKSSLAREEKTLSNQENKVHRLKSNIAILKAKIDRAKSEGKDSFDQDKYNVPSVYRKTSRNSLSNE